MAEPGKQEDVLQYPPGNKSFLLLFFKKEALAFGRPTGTCRAADAILEIARS